MRSGEIRTVKFLGVLATFLVGSLLAPPTFAVDRVGTRLPVEFRSWKVDGPEGGERTVSQLHVPLAITVGLAPTTRLVVATSGGSSLVAESGEDDRNLEGLSDTEIQLYQNLPRASLLLFGGVQLPSGVNALSPEELRVTREIANPLLGMNLRQYGRGLDFNLGAVWSGSVGGRTRLSLGLGARLSGAYEVAEDTAEFRPGDQASATADLSFRSEALGRRKSAGVGASVRVFGSDEQGGEVVFEEGTELQIDGNVALPLKGADWQSQLRAVFKAENTSFDRSGTLPVPRTLDSGTGLWAGSSLLAPWGESLALGPEVRMRFLRGRVVGNGDGWALELGPRLSLAAGRESRIDLSAAFLLGRMGQGEGRSDLRGFALGLGSSWRLR